MPGINTKINLRGKEYKKIGTLILFDESKDVVDSVTGKVLGKFTNIKGLDTVEKIKAHIKVKP